MVIKEESGLKFGFPEKSMVIKFDDTLFYRDYFNRIAPDNKKKETASTTLDLTGRDSLDIEVTQKVAMTIASMIGAKSFGDKKDCLSEFDKFIQFLSSESFSDDSKKKYVILFLEGDFGSKTRSKKMIMQSLQDSMNRKLRWFNCRVSVVDSDSYDPKVFQITS